MISAKQIMDMKKTNTFDVGGEVIQEISTHKAVRNGDKIDIILKGIQLEDLDVADEKLYSIPAENEEDLFSIFENLEETNRVLRAEAESGMYAEGGRVEFTDTDTYSDRRRRLGSVKIWEDYKNIHGKQSVGAFAHNHEGKKVGDYYLFTLDAYDRDFYSHIPLKPNEILFRIETETSKISKSLPLVKINIDKGLIYFMSKDNDANSDDDDKNPKFEKTSAKVLWLSLDDKIQKYNQGLIPYEEITPDGGSTYAGGGGVGDSVFNYEIIATNKTGEEFVVCRVRAFGDVVHIIKGLEKAVNDGETVKYSHKNISNKEYPKNFFNYQVLATNKSGEEFVVCQARAFGDVVHIIKGLEKAVNDGETVKYSHKNIENSKFEGGGGVDGFKRFDVDFYDSSDANMKTSVELIIREASLDNAIKDAIKKAHELKKNYIEFYHRGFFLGSINFAISNNFREGKFYDKFISNNLFADGGGVDEDNLEELWIGYASAILFAETDLDTEEPLDGNYSISDFDEETVKSSKDLIRKFYFDNQKAIEDSGLDLETIGNDIWYTRAGHGAGFFDHNLDKDVEDKLTKGANALGEYPTVETYDGKISVSGGRVFSDGGSSTYQGGREIKVGGNTEPNLYFMAITKDTDENPLTIKHYTLSQVIVKIEDNIRETILSQDEKINIYRVENGIKKELGSGKISDIYNISSKDNILSKGGSTYSGGGDTTEETVWKKGNWAITRKGSGRYATYYADNGERTVYTEVDNDGEVTFDDELPMGVQERVKDFYRESREEPFDRWEDEALWELREEQGDYEIEITDEDSEYITIEGDAGEFIVFEDENKAEKYAVNRVKDDLEENPEYFTDSWLEGYISSEEAENFFRPIYEERDRSYAEDIKSESSNDYPNRLVEEMVERGVMSEEDAQSDDAEEIAEDRIDTFVEHMVEEKILGDGGYEHYKLNFGDEEAKKLVIEHGLIDIDDASQGAVDTDGIGHFLSGYDGEMIELPSGAVAFRTN